MSPPAHSWNCCHSVCHSSESPEGCWPFLQRYLVLGQIMCLWLICQMWCPCAKIIQIIMKKILFLITTCVRIIFEDFCFDWAALIYLSLQRNRSCWEMLSYSSSCFPNSFAQIAWWYGCILHKFSWMVYNIIMIDSCNIDKIKFYLYYSYKIEFGIFWLENQSIITWWYTGCEGIEI